MSCVVNGEDAWPTLWTGVLEKAVWQLFLGQAMTRGFSDLWVGWDGGFLLSLDESELG